MSKAENAAKSLGLAEIYVNDYNELTGRELIITEKATQNIPALWRQVIDFQLRHFPDWRTRPTTGYSSALAEEAGEVCHVVNRREGGGTNRYSKAVTDNASLLEEASDTLIQLILVLARYGLTAEQLQAAFNEKMKLNEVRMEHREGLE